MDDPEARKIVQPSAGIHIVLPEYYSPRNMGLLDPSTSDGRVIFFLPWQGEQGPAVCVRDTVKVDAYSVHVFFVTKRRIAGSSFTVWECQVIPVMS